MFNVLRVILYISEQLFWICVWLLIIFKRFLYYEVILYMVRVKIWPYSSPEYKKKTRILLLITHTDDGCIYFGPIIMTLLRTKNCELHVMCMLDNSHDKYSQSERILKKEELLKSCLLLGIPEGNVVLVTREFISKVSYLNNNFTSCANCVLNYIEGINAEYIYTFDKKGVNNHPNHVFLFRTMSYMCMRRVIPPDCKVFKLQTTSFFRRFSLFADLLFSEWKSKYIFLVSPSDRLKIKEALNVFPTQTIWYNRILFQLSRFSYINTVEEMPVFKNYTHLYSNKSSESLGIRERSSKE